MFPTNLALYRWVKILSSYLRRIEGRKYGLSTLVCCRTA